MTQPTFVRRLASLCIVIACAGAAGLAVAWPTSPAPPPSATPDPRPLGDVVIRKPDAPRVKTNRTDRDGRPIEVACSVCHSTRTPNPKNVPAKLNEFHQGLSFEHGKVGCLSCHDARDYDRLHLADGKPVTFPDVMTLCGQCHGPQKRDYDHGAHGGMKGHWDLKRGGRVRNTCTDCHDPHAPAYPKVRPAFPPAKDNRHG